MSSLDHQKYLAIPTGAPMLGPVREQINVKQVSEIVGKKPETITAWVKTGKFLKPIDFAAHGIPTKCNAPRQWYLDEVLEWHKEMESNKVASDVLEPELFGSYADRQLGSHPFYLKLVNTQAREIEGFTVLAQGHKASYDHTKTKEEYKHCETVRLVKILVGWSLWLKHNGVEMRDVVVPMRTDTNAELNYFSTALLCIIANRSIEFADEPIRGVRPRTYRMRKVDEVILPILALENDLR
jgi:hypothetical protein